MDQTTVDSILERLDSLGEISVQGFEILVKQAVILAYHNLLWGTIWLIVSITLAIIAKKTYRGELFPSLYTNDDNYSRTITHSFKEWGLFYGFLSLAFLFIALPFYTHAVMRLINPEYFVIKMLLP